VPVQSRALKLATEICGSGILTIASAKAVEIQRCLEFPQTVVETIVLNEGFDALRNSPRVSRSAGKPFLLIQKGIWDEATDLYVETVELS